MQEIINKKRKPQRVLGISALEIGKTILIPWIDGCVTDHDRARNYCSMKRSVMLVENRGVKRFKYIWTEDGMMLTRIADHVPFNIPVEPVGTVPNTPHRVDQETSEDLPWSYD